MGDSSRVDRRTQILEATCRVIVRDGIDGIRSAVVAEEAGVSPALPHYYYTTLEDLEQAVFGFVAAREDAAAAPLPAEPIAALEALVGRPFVGDEADVRELWILRTEFQRRGLFESPVGELVRERAVNERSALRELVSAAQTAREVPARVDPDVVALGLASLVDGLGTLVLVGLMPLAQARAQVTAMIARRQEWMRTADVSDYRPQRSPGDVAAADPDNSRDLVLEATVQLIAEAGVAGVHFPEVAERGGVSASLPRYYFPTIGELVRAAFAYNAERTRVRVEHRAMAVADPLERLRDAYAYEVALDPGLVRPNWVLWSELVRRGILDEGARQQVVDRIQGWMAYDRALLAELQAADRVARDLDVDGAITRLVATLNGAGMQWMLGAIDASTFADLLNHAMDDELGLG